MSGVLSVVFCFSTTSVLDIHRTKADFMTNII